MYPHEVAKLHTDALAFAMLMPLRDFGRSDSRLFETHGFSPIGGYHRDSGPLDRVNHEAVMKRLQAIDADSVEEGSCSHWAVGWTRPIIVQVKLPDGSLNEPILNEIQTIAEELDGYPVLDDEALSNLEHEEFMESIEDGWLGTELVDLHRKLFDPEWERDDPSGSDIWSAISDEYNHDRCDTNGDPDLNFVEVENILRGIGPVKPSEGLSMGKYDGPSPHPTSVVLEDGSTHELEWYGCSGDGDYFKAKAPGGGTIEVHLLNASYIDGHPDAYGEVLDQ